ncbi:MAG: hypoxanthine phosphoribosyltransferase [Oscillospiraceae bacterium]|jgi:hypoxanthine phosphoribosyltransferase|nr:hypoxanthine phosphoribosyltransferase [Oscillospiraceae bacterium]
MILNRIIVSEDQISARVGELADEIDSAYFGQRVLIIGALKGAFVFVADLVRRMMTETEVDFLSLSSYGVDSRSSGTVETRLGLSSDITGRHVLIVDDILDTGVTLSHAVEVLKAQSPASVKVCVLLDKPERRIAQISADFIGFAIPDVFVVGYGMDYAERWRGLPYIADVS